MQELMADDSVTGSMARVQQYVDRQKLQRTLGSE
jgi:hypothetical protein